MRDVARSATLGFQGLPKSESRPLGGVAKRGFDILGAVAGLVLLSPLFLMVAALVKLSDGGSVFFGHNRIGRSPQGLSRRYLSSCWHSRGAAQRRRGDSITPLRLLIL